MKKNFTRRTMLTIVGFGMLVFSLNSTAINTDNETGLKITENSGTALKMISTLSVAEIKTISVNTSRGVFSQMIVPGYGKSSVEGDPQLPFLKELIEIPQGAVCDVTVTFNPASILEFSLSDLGMLSPIFPLQPSLSKSDNPNEVPFLYNEGTYTSNNFISYGMARVVDVGTTRGVRMGRLEICPFEYNPVTGIIRVYTEMVITVNFTNADLAATQQLKERYWSPYFENSFRAAINYKSGQPKTNFTKYPVKYVIVAPPAFQTALQPFVQWKTKKGFTVVEAYTNDPGVGATTTSIKNYLQGLYNAGTTQDPAPSFVLFVGDVAQVPAFAGTTGSHVTDLYFCEYTGDLLPEAYYGRFSATTVPELQPQIDKTLEYEQYLMPDPSFLDTCVMIAGQDPNYGPTYGDGQINYGTDTYFNVAHGLYSHTYLHAVSGSSAGQIITDVSRGACFVNYTAHGGPTGWSNPAFSNSDIASLNNNHKFPLMVGNCCLTNKFDEPLCFGEALLRASEKGALGYIGGSNNTYWDEDYWWGVGYRVYGGSPPLHPPYDAAKLGAYDRSFHDHGEIFDEWYTTQGQMISAGNLAVTQAGGSADYYWEIYHLMGDPSLMVYYSVPDPMIVSYNALMPLGSTSFVVTTNAPYSYAAVSMNGTLYGAALADNSGIATITLDPITIPGTADVVVTCQNRAPYFGTVVVASPNGPYVLYTANIVDDVAGNNDGLVDFGENIALDVTLKNFGVATANGVNATLSSSNPFITISDNTQSWGSIISNAFSTQTGAYAVTIANNVNDQEVAQFHLAIVDNLSNNWTGDFSLIVNAPVLNIGNMTIDDVAGGNGNGALDADETVNIVINTLNDGHCDAPSTVGTLTSSSPFIIINTGTHNFGTLVKAGNSNAVFNISVSPTIPDTAVVELTYTVVSGAYNKTIIYYIPIGLAQEDWETGTMTKYNWQTDGVAPWSLTTVNPYEGVYCSQSGNIDDDQNSDLYINMNIMMSDTLSFFYKTSCEQGSIYSSWWDFLEFSVDGVSQDKWDGETPWTKASYVVAAGQHTFKWSYIKDNSVSNGSDCGWVDFIIFPPIMTIIGSVGEETSDTPDFTCYPNPAQGLTTIIFNIPEEAMTSLRIYDATGRIVSDIIDNVTKQAGTYTLLFDASRFANGVYYVSLNAGNYSQTKPIVVSH